MIGITPSTASPVGPGSGVLGQILDSLDAVVYVADPQTHEVLYVNRPLRETWGDLVGKICWQTIQEGQTGPCAFCTNKRLLSADAPPDQVIVWEVQNTVNGRWYECRDRLINWPDGRRVRLEIATDITARKEAEQRELESQLRFKTLVDNIPGLVYRCSLKPPWRVSYFSEGALRICGYPASEFLFPHNRVWGDQVHADDVERVDAEVSRAVQEHRRFELEYRIWHADRNLRWVYEQGRAIYDANNEPLHLEGVIVDVTERKLAEKNLEDTRRRRRLLFEQATEGILLLDTNARIVEVNEAFARMHGYTVEALQQMSVADLDSIEDRKLIPERMASVLRGEPLRFDTEQYHKDGHLVSLRVTASRVEVDGQMYVLAFHSDITQQKRLEAQLLHAQKMEAIGTLAGGIAHDFNNLLGGLLGSVSLLELELGERNGLQQELEEMKALIQRGAQLTKQLLGFAYRGKFEAKPLDLNLTIEKTGQMFGRTRKDLVIRLELAPGPLPVVADPTQLEQVLLNLFVNAGQAMPSGGALVLTTQRCELSAAEVAPHGLSPGTYASFSVKDTGCGMDAATRARIFEPFFTTKEVGRGTGLGLASVYGIVKNHGGFVTVESQLGRGSTFSVFLPAAKEVPVEAEGNAVVPRLGGETILVVDDEEPIVRVCSRMLQGLGYQVLTARSGREAIEIVREQGPKIGLVILDMIMPEMSGLETLTELKRIAPKVKVLVSSGYSRESLRASSEQASYDGFIAKPFDVRTLSEKLRELL